MSVTLSRAAAVGKRGIKLVPGSTGKKGRGVVEGWEGGLGVEGAEQS